MANKKIQPITHDEWIDAMFKPLPPKPDGWFTVNEVAEKTNSNARTIRGKIYEMTKRNELLVMDCLINGKVAKCYKRK